MKPGEYDLIIEQGSLYHRVFTWEGVDLTGFTAKAQIRAEYTNALIHEITVTVTPGTDSDVEIEIPATTTDDFTFGRAKWDLQLTPPSGDAARFTFLKGTAYLGTETTV